MFLTANDPSNELDHYPSEVYVRICVAEGVYGAVDVAEAIADVVCPQWNASGTLGDDHNETAEGCPADDVTGQDRTEHLQGLDMFPAFSSALVFPRQIKFLIKKISR